MPRAVPYQPDVTVIPNSNPNPLQTLVFGSLLGGVVLGVLATWLSWLLATGTALIVCGALVFLYFIVLCVYGVRIAAAAAYLAPISIPLLLSWFFRYASPTVIYAVMLPASVMSLCWLADQIICVGARLKARHLNAVTAVVRERAEYYLANRFGSVNVTDLRNWLLERISTLSEDQATEIVLREREYIGQFNEIAASYRRTLGLNALCTAVGVCALWLACWLPFYVVFFDALAVVLSVVPFVVVSLQVVGLSRVPRVWSSFYAFLRRYYLESPPFDRPSVYIPRSGDWTQRMVLAAVWLSLCSLTITVTAHFFPLVAPATLEDQWFQAALVADRQLELDEFRDELRAEPARWISCNFALLKYNTLLPPVVFFTSFMCSLAVPLLFVVSVIFGAASRMVWFLDRRITFLPPDGE